MLGKQGWRLMTNPESLCARVLKRRYYHDGDFLTCTRKKRSSHTWRGILAGREVLTQGLIKRIGDGTSTGIWRDRWLPNHFGGKQLTPEDGQQVSMVSDLLADGQWDEDAIRQAAILRRGLGMKMCGRGSLKNTEFTLSGQPTDYLTQSESATMT